MPIPAFLANEPQLVVYKFQIWRIVTSPFAEGRFIGLLIGLWMYLMRAYELERVKGTARFSVYFVSMAVVVNLLSAVIGIIALKIFGFHSFEAGLWPMILLDLTID
jgi:membrane associated rhomboid family serine protease